VNSERIRTAILISGRGSNMTALIDAAASPTFPAEIALVISNRPGAPGLARAASAGLTCETIDHKLFPDRETFETAVDTRLIAAGVQLVCLAGFMRILTPGFIERWAGRLINIHPSLLPSFRGLDTHARAIAEGVKIHGCTVHHVVPDVDAGPIIAQAAVPVLTDDTSETLAARVLEAEHRLYPFALELVASGRAVLDGSRIRIADDRACPALISPSLT
jgi:phosphoribosylglycinamide formyltransferase-1